MLFRYVFLLLLGLGLSNCRVVRYETVYRPISPVDAQRKPQRVILMIGDGMGLAQITASMYRNANQTPMERFPVVGLQKCHSTDALATDSAAAATAMACGVKTFNSAIGVDVDTLPRTSVLVEAERLGWATGIVTTSSIVHA
ncbi:MAG: alkaline phosphatase, partial [Bacteroidota bacterium]